MWSRLPVGRPTVLPPHDWFLTNYVNVKIVSIRLSWIVRILIQIDTSDKYSNRIIYVLEA